VEINMSRMGRAGHIIHVGEMRNAGKHERKRQLGKPRHRWECSIRMDLREIGWEVMD
jgi:hypothetical protein